MPLETGEVVAIDRETGVTNWRAELETVWPVAVGAGKVFVAASDELHALDAATGTRLWRAPFDERAVLGPMQVRANRLFVLTSPDELRALRIDDGFLLWRHEFGGRASNATMAIGDDHAYVVREENQVIAVDVENGRARWRQTLPGQLSQPASGKDRLFVGSSDNHLYALDAGDGDVLWQKVVGGDVVGAIVDQDLVYVASLGNVLWGLKRGNGNAEWWQVTDRAAMFPPLATTGVAVHVSRGNELVAVDGKTGKPLGTFPVTGDIRGAPLVAPALAPFKLGVWVLLASGELLGLRPESMAFKEKPATPLETLPGRGANREPTRDGLPDPRKP